MVEDFPRYSQQQGWMPANPSFWKASRRPRYAFLAPPLDTIPSPSGNAIYCLVERLVERLGPGIIAMAVKPSTGETRETPIHDRLLYYQHALQPSRISRWMPNRLKKFVFGTGAPELRQYASSAGALLRTLQVKGVIVQDVPILVSALANASGPTVKRVLHQHCNALPGLPPRHWKQMCQSLAGVVFVSKKSQQVAKHHQGKLPMPFRVIYNGVDLAQYDPTAVTSAALRLRERLAIPADCTVLLFVGRLLPDKGVAESAEAFHRAGVANSRMLIVGDPNIKMYRDEGYLRRLNNAVEHSGGRIHLIGKVAQSDLPPWYAASDVVIVPSIGAEGLPKIVTEALAMGKPVLASDRGGSWELLREGENGWLIKNPSDVESTAGLIKQVLSDRQKLLNLSPRILERDRPFMSEERMVKEFADTLADWMA